MNAEEEDEERVWTHMASLVLAQLLDNWKFNSKKSKFN